MNEIFGAGLFWSSAVEFRMCTRQLQGKCSHQWCMFDNPDEGGSSHVLEVEREPAARKQGGTCCPSTAHYLCWPVLTVLVAHAKLGHKLLLPHDCFPLILANCGTEGKKNGYLCRWRYKMSKQRHRVTSPAGPETKTGCHCASSPHLYCWYFYPWTYQC